MLLSNEELDYIAVELHYSQHGLFLKTFGEAWSRADIYNKHHLRGAFMVLIEKYRLQDLLNYEFGSLKA